MVKYIKEHILAVTIGVAGFLSALVTMFVNLNETVNVKWLIFTIFIMLIIIVILVGIVIEFLRNEKFNEKSINQLKLKPLNQKTERGEVFLNQSNINLNYGDVVKIYYLNKDNVENFIGIGVISHIQENQKICHINYELKRESNTKYENVYFSLKINIDELKALLEEKGDF